MRLFLGNRDAFDVVDGEKTAFEGNFRTQIDFPEGISLVEAFTNVTAGDGVWANHSFGDDSKPAWVACDDPNLANLIAAEYGCEVREIDEDSDGSPVLPGGN
jgi:hypothetical protein